LLVERFSVWKELFGGVFEGNKWGTKFLFANEMSIYRVAARSGRRELEP
jgi:hypothetical protein